MSLPSTPAPPAQPKQMSSRLLTMKFMQRASATNTPSKANSPSEPALKRRKTGDHVSTPDSSAVSTPGSERPVFADKAELHAATKAQALQDALAAERRAQQGFANNTNETQWVLDVDVPVTNGADEDEVEDEEDDEEDDWSEENGRQTYGSFKRQKKGVSSTSNTPNTSKKDPDAFLSGLLSSDEDEGEVDSDDLDSDTGAPRSKKRKVSGNVDFDDDAALDRVDLSKSNYAKAKKAGLPFTGAKPGGKQGFGKDKGKRDHPRDRRGDKHPKKGKRSGGKDKKK